MLESKKDISHIIFGGTSGIGALLAKKLSERGLGVAITGRRPEAKVSGGLSYLQANFSDSSDYETVKFYIGGQPALSHFIQRGRVIWAPRAISVGRKLSVPGVL